MIPFINTEYIQTIAKTVLERYDNAKVADQFGQTLPRSRSLCETKYKIPVDASEISVAISNYAQTTRTLDELDLGPVSINADDVDAFMNQPIQLFVEFEDYVVEQDVIYQE